MAAIREIEEFAIGFSIIARSVFSGIEEAVREMKKARLGSWDSAMIRGVGIDMVDVKRFKAAMKRFKGRLEKEALYRGRAFLLRAFA